VETKETNGYRAAQVIFEALSKDGGMSRREIEDFGDPEQDGSGPLPRNRAGYYIREGVDFINSHPDGFDKQVVRDGTLYTLVAPK
jgi:hypothetical protein